MNDANDEISDGWAVVIKEHNWETTVVQQKKWDFRRGGVLNHSGFLSGEQSFLSCQFVLAQQTFFGIQGWH